MKKYNEIEGDLIELAKQGNFDVIAHGCNCFCNMGAGIAPLMAEAFGCNELNLEIEFLWEGDVNKLGQIEFVWVNPNNKNQMSQTKTVIHTLGVINSYTQYFPGSNLDYEALTLCLRKINHEFKGKHIGLPLIGCGLAGGIWDYKLYLGKIPLLEYNKYKKGVKKDVKTIIQEELKDCNVTIVFYNKNK